MSSETTPYAEDTFLRTTQRSVNWLAKRSEAEELELRPPFQRNLVWNESEQSFLIDTILNGYPIPELYMQETVDEDGNERHVVVDGQQRITACLLFLEGSLILSGENVSRDWLDLSFADLEPLLKRRIRSYQFVVRLLPAMPDAELSLIFQRLNRNVKSLKAQELRHATFWGEFIKSVEETAENPFWEESGVFTANDFRRMLDAEFISELYVAVLHGPLNKKVGLERWYEIYDDEFEQREEIEDTFVDVLRELRKTLPDLRKMRWRKKSDFYTLFLTFAAHKQDLPLSRDGRQLATRKLTDFGAKVSEFVSKSRPPNKSFPKYVEFYAEAVQRAASDRANRVQRQKHLETLLRPVWDA